jgi:hypothetical protein
MMKSRRSTGNTPLPRTASESKRAVPNYSLGIPQSGRATLLRSRAPIWQDSAADHY